MEVDWVAMATFLVGRIDCIEAVRSWCPILLEMTVDQLGER